MHPSIPASSDVAGAAVTGRGDRTVGDQLDLLRSQPPTPSLERITRQGLALRIWPRWLPQAWRVLQELEGEVPWRQEQICLWGRTHPLPRLTCWMGDPGCSYTYSGVRNTIVPWTPAVQILRHQVQEQVGWRFNSLLLNLYRDGRDKLDWHADDEAELDPAAPIASLSLGASRSFRLRPGRSDRQPADTLSFELGQGDLLVMDPPTQQHWQHQVPARLRLQEARLNLTFRSIRREALRHG